MKYEITDEVHPQNSNLKRIRALRDIPRHSVKAGDLGGYVESEDNLSQEGDAWIYGEASVYGGASVFGNASVSEDAWVFGNASVYGKFATTPKVEVSKAEIAKRFGISYEKLEIVD